MSWPWTAPGDWLARTALGGCLLLLVVWALTACTRQPARRQRLAECGVLAALLLALLTLAPSWLPLPTPFGARSPLAHSQPLEEESVPDAWASAGPEFSAEPVGGASGLGAMVPVEELSSPRESTPQPEDSGLFSQGISLSAAASWLIASYIVVVIALLGRWLFGHFVLWRFLRKAVAVPEPVTRLFLEMTPQWRRRPRLLMAPRLRVPVSCGLFRPTVVLPAGLCDPPQRSVLRWVFAHELTHLQRRDAWSCLLFGLSGAVYFYCPWFWWLRRQVRLCREYVADAAAVRLAQAEDYAQFLLSLATAPAGPVTAIGVGGQSSDLFRRVTMLLKNPLRVEMQCPPRWALAMAVSFLAVAVLASGLGLRAADPAADQVAKATADDKKQDPNTDKSRPSPADYRRAFEDVKKALEKLDLDKLKTNEDLDKLRQRLLKDAEEFDKALKGLQTDPSRQRAFEGLLENTQRFGGPRPMLAPQGGFRFALGGHDGRLGATVERPNSALADQLDLPKGQGLVVIQVQPDSAAAKAGLKANDILLELNGKKVSDDGNELRKMVHEMKANTPIDAVVLRKGKKETIKGLSLPDAPPEPRPGLPPRRFRTGSGGATGSGGIGEGFVPGQPGDRAPSPSGPGGGGGFGRPGGILAPAFPGNPFGAPGANTVMTSVFRNNDRFTGRHQEGSLVISVTGAVGDGKAKVSEIHVQDGNETHKGENLDKIPERYRDKVKNLIDMCEKGSVKVEIRQSSGTVPPGGF